MPAFSETKSIYTTGSMTSNNIIGGDEDPWSAPVRHAMCRSPFILPPNNLELGTEAQRSLLPVPEQSQLEVSGHQALEDVAHSRSTRMLPPICVSALILHFLLCSSVVASAQRRP